MVANRFPSKVSRSSFCDREPRFCQSSQPLTLHVFFAEKEKTEEGEEKPAEEHDHVTEPAKPTEAAYLLVLTDRELVAIDLTQPSWPVIPSPYLKHLDCSGITAMAYASVSRLALPPLIFVAVFIYHLAPKHERLFIYRLRANASALI